ncbi:hydrolase 2, exosortase A system-associated [Massilia sp. CF038]|uniref:hydrolase 2, exosortase A system-associated n=1 Tax=Massilia sp. CF038 TaxID=1881045 RepID=UPI000919DB25|nr:hydrolase 2, exosortase A system-associated [Massilia sp. CF038]SHH41813.1 exosortase A system-associated hydrolase 2 [Massilia sp. CF038]
MPDHAPAHAFFLAVPPGERYCLYHAPVGACRGALVYVHPFAEEMNKSRRMAALQARALAAAGYGVLQIDLYGCGDSDGDFGQARWEQWHADLAAARAWLGQQLGRPAGLWGLRLGALLALEHAHTNPVPQLLLWQPVLQGASYLTQFLRLRVANDMLDEGANSGGTKALRAELDAGHALEIAGYELAPQLAARIDALDAAQLAPACPTHWIEIVAAAERPLPPAAGRVAQTWGQQPPVKVAGAAFWSTQEIAECPELIAATCAMLTDAQHV